MTLPIDLSGVASVKLSLKKAGYEDYEQIVESVLPEYERIALRDTYDAFVSLLRRAIEIEFESDLGAQFYTEVVSSRRGYMDVIDVLAATVLRLGIGLADNEPSAYASRITDLVRS